MPPVLVASQIFRNRVAQAQNALFHILIGRGGEVQAERTAGCGAVDHKVAARHKGNTLAQREVCKLLRIAAFRQRAPKEQAAVRTCVGDALIHVLVEQLEHKIAALAIDFADFGDMRVDIRRAEPFVGDDLEEDVGVAVAELLGDGQTLQNILLRHDKADAHSGGKYLGVRAVVDDNALVVHGFEGRNVLAAEAKLAVGVVLENHNAVFDAQRIDRLAAGKAHGFAAGILEGRNDIKQPDVRLGLEGTLKPSQLHALFVHLDAHDVCAVNPHGIDAADEGRKLHDDRVAGVAEDVRRQGKTLLSAGGDNQVIKLAADAKLFFQPLPCGLAQLG